jgi:ElaB/YqjD/DUF883 family membrane-anchored ribosome-binding protein
MSTQDSPNSAGAASEASACGGVGSAAADALHRAKADLEKKAHEALERFRSQAAAQVEAVREKTVGELIDGAVEFAREHPVVTVAAAAATGFCLGRMLSRLQTRPCPRGYTEES